MAKSEAASFVGFCLWVCVYMAKGLNAGEVTYDGTSLIVNGERKLLISGSIHYARSTPDMWPGLIDKAKEGGLNCIQTYVFWNLHEPQQGKFNFQGRADLIAFVKLIHSKGMYVNLRIGPYIEAEWNFGGFPYWLSEIPDIVFRTDNEPFKREMQRFTEMIVNMMKKEGLFASQGGPIVIAQIENEYGTVEHAYRGGRSYVNWAAHVTVGLNTSVPWIMCKQPDAPDPIINTCNGLYCGDTFIGPNSNKKPKMWTENWTGWFQVFGGAKHRRPVEDIAYAVARFYAKNGTFVNYYMYHGGTNFGRSGGPFITASYDYDAPLDEYGNKREPKWSHLKDLNTAIMLSSPTLLSARAKTVALGPSQEAQVYINGLRKCVAFLSNMNPRSNVTVKFGKRLYDLPAWSVSILPDCRTVLFNTAKLNAQSQTLNSKSNNPDRKPEVKKGFDWEAFKEEIGGSEDNQFEKGGLLEQISTTKDTTDYLWYNTRVDLNESEPVIRSNVLAIESKGYSVHIFVNDAFVGSAHGNKTAPGFSLNLNISLRSGKNDVSLLSVVNGLPVKNAGGYFERKTAGITSVVIQGFKDGAREFSQNQWAYQIGLVGEKKNIFTKDGSQTVRWSSSIPNQPLTWYKTTIDAPEGDEPVSLDLSSMGKGHIWINGENLGRYWVSFLVPPEDCSRCDYRGLWTLKRCATKCGQPSQTLYHIPRSLLQPTGNFLVLFEEIKGDPSKVSLVTGSVND